MQVYDVVKDQKGHLDILFANAGIAQFAPLGEISEEHFDKIFRINVKGLLFTVQKALPILEDGGSIILNASIGSSKGVGGSSVYSATKAAVRSFARTWTVDLRDRNIRVNAISPGPIDTPIFSSITQNKEQSELFKKNIVNTVPMKRMGSSDEVAKAVSFLASNESSYVTGIELFVDGGLAQI
jgi:NAD(P)-dependent dehydrogenase (short-subunit alcohol dehydrogenase family)